MPTFHYIARGSDGQRSEGTLTANDRPAALAQLERQRLVPIKVVAGGDGKPTQKAGDGKAAAPTHRVSLSYSHQFLFTEQLAHLLGAGMTLDESLAILEKRLKHPKLRSLSSALHRALVDGRSLSSALRDFPKIFTPLYVNMVSAAEASGTLAEILRRLTVYLADVKSLRERVQQALVYPAVLLVAGFGLVTLFMTVMVPQLTSFFAQTGQELPGATKALLAANDFLLHRWWTLVLAGAGIFGAWKVFTRSEDGRKAWDRFILGIPGYGHIVRYRFYAQFARTLGTLIENGVTLLRALELLEDISGNAWIRGHLVDARKAVMDGVSLSNALRPRKIFPELFLDMMSVGEQTGRFGETMQMIANVYERELDKQVKLTSTLIPPVIMIVIAIIVGTVVFGILTAVFNLTTGLRSRVR